MWSERVEEGVGWLQEHNMDPGGQVRKRKDGQTDLWKHSWRLTKFAHEVLGATDDVTLLTGLFHDTIEDFGITFEALVARWGLEIGRGVNDLTDVKIYPADGISIELSWEIRHREKCRRVPAWPLSSVLASASDIFDNHTLPDRATPDPICRPRYLTWSIDDMLPALDRRARLVGWEGPPLLSLVAPAVMELYRAIDSEQ